MTENAGTEVVILYFRAMLEEFVNEIARNDNREKYVLQVLKKLPYKCTLKFIDISFFFLLSNP